MKYLQNPSVTSSMWRIHDSGNTNTFPITFTVEPRHTVGGQKVSLAWLFPLYNQRYTSLKIASEGTSGLIVDVGIAEIGGDYEAPTFFTEDYDTSNEGYSDELLTFPTYGLDADGERFEHGIILTPKGVLTVGETIHLVFQTVAEGK